MAAVHCAVVAGGLRPDGAHGVGQGRPAECLAGRPVSHASISPAARWCTSPRAFRRWSARSIWASGVGYPKEPMPPHSVVLSFIGACLLWVGWFGFNAGSALAAGTLATSAFVATHFGAAAAAIGWMAAEWIRNGKPSALGAISGAVAGLVAITPAAGFVSPMSRSADRIDRGRVLLLDGGDSESAIRLRRLARRLRRPWRGRNVGRDPHRRLRFERDQSDFQGCRMAMRCPSA